MFNGSNAKMKQPKRLAFILPNASKWIGGVYYYIRSASLLLSRGKEFEVLLVTEENLPSDCLDTVNSTSGLSYIKTDIFNKRSIFRKVIFGEDKKITKFCKDNSIDAIFENANFLGWRNPVPVISWIPDLQHIYLPEYFSFLTRIKRTIGFTLQGFFSRRVIVSSFDAKTSLLSSIKIDKRKIDVVRFAVSSPKVSSTSINEIIELYDIDKDFIFLPNQFWPHKNHEIVLHAIKYLKEKGYKSTQVVCSGSTNSMAYKSFSSLKEKLGIGRELKVLGLIPKDHVVHLQNFSKAIINPSLFEGWSTTVEEAKSLNKNLILSDIAIHREQVKSKVVFFQPSSYQDLAMFIKDDFIFSEEDVNNENDEETYYEELRKSFLLAFDK
ncbi:glycosyltransferase [Vibrio parahaemolyticus]|uniref:glycosyltransferase n=1 Tax=Vibrio parahaemolyticus TaxID=670 RepID=UPI002556AF20|nr:glycosyltransferase [Vibrio parahaemolyticus]MDL2003459.1 glycosyltransferase [Vibrio parahaemolyticus]